MTDDGGLAESLNAYVDNGEIAPVVKPDSVEGLIDNNEKRLPVYIHSSPHYKNVILFDPALKRIYYKNQLLIQLSSDSEFKDAASIGNILYIAAGIDSGYFLFNDGKEYKKLGGKIPFPTLKLQDQGSTFYGSFVAYDGWTQNQANQDLMFYENVWNRYDGEGNNTLQLASDIAKSLNAVIGNISTNNYYINPIVARYAIRLYNGSILTSVPFLIAPNCIGGFSSISGTFTHTQTENPADPEPVNEEQDNTSGEENPDDGSTDNGASDWRPWYKEEIEVDYSCYRYRLKATLMDFPDSVLDEWKDIITDIDIYISENIAAENTKSIKVINSYQGAGYAEANFTLGGNWDKESAITSKGIFYRIASFSLNVKEDIKKLREGIELTMPSLDALAVMDRLDSMEDVMEGDSLLPQTVSAFNNRLIGANMTIEMSRGPKFYGSSVPGSNFRKYYFRFFLNNKDGSEAQALAQDYRNQAFFSDSDSIPHGWIAHPNVNCTKVQICTDDGYFIEASMKPHPTLNCSYAYLGTERLFSYMNMDSNAASETIEKKEAPFYTEDRKILLSEMDNPMIFPIGNRYSFSGSVIGVAIATSALSQGQFGQFPLYIFTNEGIWVMQTSDTGTFVTSKPLSRDVCVNAKSITPIDQSVVFVSEKGVMLLSGSQIINLSPYMNGKHYSIEPGAKSIVENQEHYKSISETLVDTSPFMSFIKEAYIGYDYPGMRLIFVNPNKSYQYVYKLDTQTWHKLHHSELKLELVLNCYPECYAVASIKAKTEAVTETEAESETSSRVIDLSTHLDTSEEQQTENIILATRSFDLAEPDVFKTIRDVRVRGQFPKGAVKFILLGSNDGIHFNVINTLRGKSWKLFRLIILADLAATDRISWVEVGYETRFTNKLR